MENITSVKMKRTLPLRRKKRPVVTPLSTQRNFQHTDTQCDDIQDEEYLQNIGMVFDEVEEL